MESFCCGERIMKGSQTDKKEALLWSGGFLAVQDFVVTMVVASSRTTTNYEYSTMGYFSLTYLAIIDDSIEPLRYHTSITSPKGTSSMEWSMSHPTPTICPHHPPVLYPKRHDNNDCFILKKLNPTSEAII